MTQRLIRLATVVTVALSLLLGVPVQTQAQEIVATVAGGECPDEGPVVTSFITNNMPESVTVHWASAYDESCDIDHYRLTRQSGQGTPIVIGNPEYPDPNIENKDYNVVDNTGSAQYGDVYRIVAFVEGNPAPQWFYAMTLEQPTAISLNNFAVATPNSDMHLMVLLGLLAIIGAIWARRR